jgi:type II secretory pathway pseudopilin PulG
MKNRFGFTLVETLVVIAGCGVVMATATGLLCSIFKVDRMTRDQAAAQQTLRRLAADFRSDAHAAVKLTAAEVAVDGKRAPVWEFQLPQADHRVRYQAASRGLIREEQLGGKAVHREAYRLPDGSAASIRLESGTPALATLRITAGAPSDPPSGPPLCIEAALASDHRFAKLGGK